MAATRAADRRELAGNLARLADELLPKRRHDLRDQERLRPDRRRRSCARWRSPARVTAETTFLGAHVVPAEYRDDRDDYVSLVAGDMLAACAPHARWIDVFCDRGAFDVDETRVDPAGRRRRGPRPAPARRPARPRAGASSWPSNCGAASVDHCTYATDSDIEALARRSTTVATLLPGAEFSTRAPWPDARRFLDAGVTVALATDCNPGSSYTTSMPFCIAVAVRDMNFTPAEALWAATAGGAAALRRDDVGVLAPGMRADFVTLNAPSYIHLAYRPGVPIVRDVVVSGAPTQRKRSRTVMNESEVVVGVGPVSFADVVAVARDGAGVSISADAIDAVAASRVHIEALAEQPTPVYGVSTGFGALATRHIPHELRTQLQRSLIRSHAAGTGAEVEREVIRAMMLLRLSTLTTGRTGVRTETAQAYADLLSAGLTPVVYEYGSLGCSGDLAPLAHVALAVMGEGHVRTSDGVLEAVGRGDGRAWAHTGDLRRKGRPCADQRHRRNARPVGARAHRPGQPASGSPTSLRR